MPPGSLSRLQEKILGLLASIEPRWTLTGGAALAGFHTHHRTTRDLDLLWRGRSRLDELTRAVEERLRDAGLDVSTLQRAVSFHRYEVRDAPESCLVDLVADPQEGLTRSEVFRVAGSDVLVESRHEILANKLCALLGRAELRDLVDVRELLEHGEDLERASADASRKDGGYSAMTLSWILDGLRIEALARVAGLGEREAAQLAAFRDALVERLTSDARPDSGSPAPDQPDPGS